MSHLPERNEKVCLNCNAGVYGRYCHVCGQENIEPKENFWHLTTHFVYDITHFDGKFFSTVKYLLTRPGFLSAEYMRGRRARYLNPIRMYIFTSAFFFVIYFSFVRPSSDPEVQRQELLAEEQKLEQELAAEKDPARRAELQGDLRDVRESLEENRVSTGIIRYDMSPGDSTGTDSSNSQVIGGSDGPRTLRAYDSLQKALPPAQRDGWLERMYQRKRLSINDTYANRERVFWAKLSDKFAHSVPQMMFVSLPLIALLLRLLYVRRRRQFLYVDHAVLVIHMFIALYIILLISYVFDGLQALSGWALFGWVEGLVYLAMFYYVYKSMRNFYGQSRWKTIAKFLLLLLSSLLIFSLLMAVFLLTSILQV